MEWTGRARKRTGNLPAEVHSFVGRRRELAEITGLLSTNRLVTLTGVGGVGKTRLALRVARQAERTFPDGVWLVELAVLHQPDLLVEAIADPIGLVGVSPRPQVHVLSDYLADKGLLLVLDNCEHLVDACAPLLGTLLLAAPGLRVLATSRHALCASGEHVVPIEPLSVPGPELTSDVSGYEAVRLFAERGAAVQPGFGVTEGNWAQLAAICRRLDGIPLAIELAAAWLTVLSVEHILARLDDRFRLLTRGSRTAAPRHRTLRAVFDWSYDLCTATEATLWARLSVFVDGFDLEAAEQVCRADDLPRDEVFSVIAALVDKSVVRRSGHGFEARYSLLETTRQYGLHKLRDAGEGPRLRRRHQEYFLDLAQRCDADWFGPRQVEWCHRLRAEHANLRAALHFCSTEPGMARAGLRMASALWAYGSACGVQPAEERYWFDQLLALDQDPTTERCAALCAASSVAARQGDVQTCREMAEEARSLATRTGNQVLLAKSARKIGLAVLMSGDLHRAAVLLDEAMELFNALEQLNSDAVICRFELAAAHLFLGDLDRAAALCAEGVALCEAHGEQWALSYLLNTLTLVEFYRGDLERATGYGRRCLRIKQTLHDVMGIRMVIEELAWITAAEGDADRAAHLLGAAEQTRLTFGLSPVISASFIAPTKECEVRARRALGDETFEAAFSSGANVSLDQAVVYALGIPTPPRPDSPEELPTPLTKREQEVGELVADGLSNKEIARLLSISQRTAEGHVERILTKLGFSSRSQIAVWITERRRR